MINLFLRNLDFIEQHQVTAYRGGGTFEILEVHCEPGLNLDEISRLERINNLILPDDYRDLISSHNGLSFFHHSDCRFFDLTTAIGSYQIRGDSEHGLLVIGMFNDDYILIDCVGRSESVFVSIEGINKSLCLNMNLGEFLEKCLLGNFLPFW